MIIQAQHLYNFTIFNILYYEGYCIKFWIIQNNSLSLNGNGLKFFWWTKFTTIYCRILFHYILNISEDLGRYSKVIVGLYCLNYLKSISTVLKPLSISDFVFDKVVLVTWFDSFHFFMHDLLTQVQQLWFCCSVFRVWIFSLILMNCKLFSMSVLFMHVYVFACFFLDFF